MDNENKTMLVRFSELRYRMDDGQVEFDVPGLVLTVGLDRTNAVVNVDALEVDDRRRMKLLWLNSALGYLASEALNGNPKAVGVVAEWFERRFSVVSPMELLGKIADVLGDKDVKEGGAE